jgi:hypothetical protein
MRADTGSHRTADTDFWTGWCSRHNSEVAKLST